MPTLMIRELVSQEAWVSGFVNERNVFDLLLDKAMHTLRGCSSHIREAYVVHERSDYGPMEEFTLYVKHTF